MTTTALATRGPQDLAGAVIHTPQELADHVRALQQVAHIISPTVAVSAIPDGYVINKAVVVIDPASTDVYSGSFHKKSKHGDTYVPTECSLSKTGLLKILAAAGVRMTRSARTDDGTVPYYWAWTSEGTITDFDGQLRPLPAGDAEVDLRDGSAQVGEWTPEEWARREAAADEKRQRSPEKDRWKVKPEPIGGWSRDRLVQARGKGLRLAQAFSLNALIRNLGLKQVYTVAELAKPFVCLRVTFIPDMSDPEVRRMVTAAHLGGVGMLYPGASSAAPAPAAVAAQPAALPAPLVEEPDEDPPAVAGAVEVDDIPSASVTPAVTAVAPDPIFTPTRTSLLEGRYFFDTAEGQTLTTDNLDCARALNDVRKAKGQVQVDGGETVTLNGKPLLQILSFRVLPTAGAIDPGKL